MISYQPLGEYPNFFRSIISNQVKKNLEKEKIYMLLIKNYSKIKFSKINFQAIQEHDVDFMLDELDRLGHDL
jgi:hypothetical protein